MQFSIFNIILVFITLTMVLEASGQTRRTNNQVVRRNNQNRPARRNNNNQATRKTNTRRNRQRNQANKRKQQGTKKKQNARKRKNKNKKPPNKQFSVVPPTDFEYVENPDADLENAQIITQTELSEVTTSISGNNDFHTYANSSKKSYSRKETSLKEETSNNDEMFYRTLR